MNEPFVDISSPIHRTAPTVRVAVAFVLSLVTALASTPTVPLAALGLGGCFLLLARLPLGAVVRRLMPLCLFLFVLWVVLPFTGEGPALGSLGPLTVKGDGLALACLISLKSFSILLILMALVSTMHTFDLGHALNALGMPTKLTFLIVMSARYIVVIEREYRKLRNAARMRGFQPDTSLHAYRTFAHMAAMLLVRSHLRAKRVYNAMVLRGFDGRFNLLTARRSERMAGCLPQTACMAGSVVALVGLEVAVRLGGI
ncbi:cobalt ECF transporter T component CbiQ [Desulfoluna spongiiphila]|uniref:cobalt ECF transporter T component CbiQ n=1 Tax=Desulfoluna spongiiphila TaxID=419481 RepID=UPI001252B4BA|nr:cobalt ECF transporter T component CbiQ [Desulfoluna spongiiphila]VVS93664.1 abc/ecf transporter transmembrane component [Desulfoluna spongiiphila]